MCSLQVRGLVLTSFYFIHVSRKPRNQTPHAAPGNWICHVSQSWLAGEHRPRNKRVTKLPLSVLAVTNITHTTTHPERMGFCDHSFPVTILWTHHWTPMQSGWHMSTTRAQIHPERMGFCGHTFPVTYYFFRGRTDHDSSMQSGWHINKKRPDIAYHAPAPGGRKWTTSFLRSTLNTQFLRWNIQTEAKLYSEERLGLSFCSPTLIYDCNTFIHGGKQVHRMTDDISTSPIMSVHIMTSEEWQQWGMTFLRFNCL